MSQVEFEESAGNIVIPEREEKRGSSLTNLFIRSGIVKTERQAEILMVLLIIIFLSISAFMLWKTVHRPLPAAPFSVVPVNNYLS